MSSTPPLARSERAAVKLPPVPPQPAQVISSLLKQLSEDVAVEPEGVNTGNDVMTADRQVDEHRKQSTELGRLEGFTRRSSIEKLKELLEALPPTQQQTFSPATKRRLRRVYPELQRSRLSTSETARPAPPQYAEAGGWVDKECISTLTTASLETTSLPATPRRYPSNSSLVSMPTAPRVAPAIDLLTQKSVLPPAPVRALRPDITATDPYLNCSPRFMRSTMIFAPRSNALLEKMKLPFGLHLYPFAMDVCLQAAIVFRIIQLQILQKVDVISTNTIRCRVCRAYINPFVEFVDAGTLRRVSMIFRC